MHELELANNWPGDEFSKLGKSKFKMDKLAYSNYSVEQQTINLPKRSLKCVLKHFSSKPLFFTVFRMLADHPNKGMI